MSRFGLVATGSDSWMLLRSPASGLPTVVESNPAVESDPARLFEGAIANLRKTSVHPELWFFQSVGDPHMIPIIAEDQYTACRKYLLQIEESEIRKEDLIIF